MIPASNKFFLRLSKFLVIKYQHFGVTCSKKKKKLEYHGQRATDMRMQNVILETYTATVVDAVNAH